MLRKKKKKTTNPIVQNNRKNKLEKEEEKARGETDLLESREQYKEKLRGERDPSCRRHHARETHLPTRPSPCQLSQTQTATHQGRHADAGPISGPQLEILGPSLRGWDGYFEFLYFVLLLFDILGTTRQKDDHRRVGDCGTVSLKLLRYIINL